MQGFVLSFSHRKIDLTKKVAVMGILNLTPDSFYDGGRYKTEKEVLERVEEMINEGADIIDVGGESTRPGAKPVGVEEELRRTVPFIQKIAEKFKIPLSIDTYKAKVAKEACEAGAEMVNDISGLRFDPDMPEVVSSKKSYLVIMHIKGTPQNMQDNPTYKALMPEIISYLEEGIEIARRAGIGLDKIIIDPGIGFGKKLEHNLSILKNLKKLTSLKRPILVSVSRKSFIGQILNLPAEKRLTGSIAAACAAVLGGARIIRCHDIKQTRQAVDVVNAIMQERVPL